MNDSAVPPFRATALAFGIALIAAAAAHGQVAKPTANARQIVEEAQKRGLSRSQRYEGLLQTFEAAGKTTEKRWIYERLGSHGNSKVIIRFTAPPEVRGVALLIV